jgi:hypothetical protein
MVPSKTRNRTKYSLPFSFVGALPERTRVVGLKVNHDGKLRALYTKLSLSVSVACIV